MEKEQKKYLNLLMEKYPSKQALYREIINLNAILNLPKGTEHFMSDLHGEYEAFYHILNNCSGVVKEKVDLVFGDSLSRTERQEICTLIYYPKEKLEALRDRMDLSKDWYRMTLNQLIEVAKLLSSKYTRSKVRKAMPEEFAYIIDELLHVQKDEDNNQELYHRKILDTILEIDTADEFIYALAALIKRLAVDHLHIVGDIYDRGSSADRILDLLMKHHSLDIEWGNHDMLWMGAAAGNGACIANVIRNNLKYRNTQILENGYGISLRRLALFAEKTYQKQEPMEAAFCAISVLLQKLEGRLILRHPEYQMTGRLLLDKINRKTGMVRIGEREYQINDMDFPTLQQEDPYLLTKQEQEIIDELKYAFENSVRLQSHVDFLYQKGSMYRIYNGNLLYHSCIPLDENGDFDYVSFDGVSYYGRAYLDYAEKVARKVHAGNGSQSELDFMWYLCCGEKSPLFGRAMRTFERAFLKEKETWVEETNPYYKYHETEKTCNMVLREFGLYSENSHIINGHTPVRTVDGEQPIRANGKLLVIDGGFCRDYHKRTGIAGYTLIFNSHGLRIKAHQPFESVQKALEENKDIESDSQTVETAATRVMVRDTDIGAGILEDIADLKLLMQDYFVSS